uniref:Uncharacterized protein n=1 Tax=Chelonoidis abingdonii TaxID=106734 RepID=A0A8C0GEI0_CHEAB
MARDAGACIVAGHEYAICQGRKGTGTLLSGVNRITFISPGTQSPLESMPTLEGKVLPLAHVSNDKNRITLINPQAVNLDAYKEKLEQALKSYERRLNLIIWRALSQEERDKFEQEEPVSYMEHKEALLQALENLGWPVSCGDVTLLEDEILAGLTYIQQASDLQEAAKKEIQRTSASYINHSKMVGCTSWAIKQRPGGRHGTHKHCVGDP